MTHLIVPIFRDSIDEIRRDIAEAAALGAEIVELRVDMIKDVSEEDLCGLAEKPVNDLPLILTVRSEAEGGEWEKGEAERIKLISWLGPYVQYIDVELSTWTANEPDRKELVNALRRAGQISHHAGQEMIEFAAPRMLILSRHDLRGRPSNLHNDLLKMVQIEECDVPKLAWRARTVRDNFEAFELMRESPKPALVVCMGPDGLPSRVLAKKFGAFGSFAALERGLGSADGQLTIREMKTLYRWDRIDADTAVYGVIGDPINHSLSPHLHNAAFEKTGTNAIYLPLRVGPGYESLKAFLIEVLDRPWLDFRGLSVTLPHKENALRFLRESGGYVDDVATRVGAVNTLVVRSNGAYEGYNTDYVAFVDTMAAALGEPLSSLAGKKAVILGAGGIARAIVVALVEAGLKVMIYNRTLERAQVLAKEFGCEFGPWSERSAEGAALVINCTSVGLASAPQESPLEPDTLVADQVVVDTIYNPSRTKLLKEAESRGCRTVGGADLFARQAAAQFKLWAKQDAATIFHADYVANLLREKESGLL